MSVLYIGLMLQVIFILLITILNFARVFIIEIYSVYPVAIFELFLGIASFLCGLYGLIRLIKPKLSIFITLCGLLICFFFVFVYLLPEAGIPPEIPWLYPEIHIN